MVDVELLRYLSVRPAEHPRRLGHLSAASGLVCAQGRAFVVADDEHHLAVFSDQATPGRLHRLLAGDLPSDAAQRKRLKPDSEALFEWPQRGSPAGSTTLVALGSGSLPQRHTGVVITLGADGQPLRAPQSFDLRGLYAPARALLGEINIEGAMVMGEALVLINRGARSQGANAALWLPLQALQRAAEGRSMPSPDVSITRYSIGLLNGVELSFTDATPLPAGGWMFSAAAEDTDNSVSDGVCVGSVLGWVDAAGTLRGTRVLAGTLKVEGIAVDPATAERGLDGNLRGLTACLVTDADDPAQSAALLRVRL